MAGVKGMKGGGGARPGSGRKPKQKPPNPEPVPQGERDMLEILQDIARGLTDATPLQVRAAIAAVQYTHAKKEGGKKDETKAKAKEAASKFSPMGAPRLVSSR